ncbi:MAG: hypothetical protein K9G64_08075 [Bacteroidia bacterium]|nr:hypothetical protein [Bacteroidia bacterium]
MMKTAQIYWSAVSKYQEVKIIKPKLKIEKRFNSEIENGLKWIIKHIGKLVPPGASEKANEIANAHGINLFALKWDNQIQAEKKINKNAKGRVIFHHEHKNDIKTLYKNILKATSENEIFNILMKQEIVWITKEEDKKLKRDSRIEDEYKKNNIKVLSNPYNDMNDWYIANWDINKNN